MPKEQRKDPLYAEDLSFNMAFSLSSKALEKDEVEDIYGIKDAISFRMLRQIRKKEFKSMNFTDIEFEKCSENQKR